MPLFTLCVRLAHMVSKGGGVGKGGGGVLNLVYGSSSSSYMDCEVHCVSNVGIRFTQCSYVVAFVDDLFIHGCSFYGSTTLRMSTRRLSVMLFVFLVSSDCYILLFVA